MRKKQRNVNVKRKRKTLRNSSSRCNTNKFRSKKRRLCLKCGEKFLSECPYNRICEKCSLINERIALKTYSVSSKPLVGEDPMSCYYPLLKEGKSSDR